MLRRCVRMAAVAILGRGKVVKLDAYPVDSSSASWSCELNWLNRVSSQAMFVEISRSGGLYSVD